MAEQTVVIIGTVLMGQNNDMGNPIWDSVVCTGTSRESESFVYRPIIHVSFARPLHISWGASATNAFLCAGVLSEIHVF